jgi:hypothetical protein
MLSALIHIKTKEKTPDDMVPVIRKSAKPKSKPAKEPKPKKPNTKEVKETTSRKTLKPYEEGVEYASFTPIEEKNVKDPEPWNDDDEDLVGGNVKFDDEQKYEGENEKYIRQDTEWKDVMKQQKNKFDEDSDSNEDSDEDIASDIKTPSVISNDYSDDYSDEHTDEVYNEVGDLADLDVFDNIDEESDYFDDVFYTKPVAKEPKEKPKRVFVGADITFDDEFIP